MATPSIYFSDLHVDEYKAFAQKRDRDRLGDCLAVIDDVYKMANKKGAETILFSGDFFNTPKFLFVPVINRVFAHLKKHINDYPHIVWYSVTGQHDFATKNLLHKPTDSAQSALATMFPDNFKLIDNQIKVVRDENDCPTLICGIPNYEFKEHFRTKLQEMAERVLATKTQAREDGWKNLKATLMIHQSPAGQYNPNVRVQTAPEDELYKVFDMVLCGDIHTSQRITNSFLIGGNSYQKDLGDEGKEKGIWYLDLEDPQNTLKFISRKGRYPEFRRVKKGEPVVDDTEDFLIQAPDVPEIANEEGTLATVDNFGATLPHDVLLTNFYNEVHGKDEKLLKTGLAFLPK